MKTILSLLFIALALTVFPTQNANPPKPIGIFDDHRDIGAVKLAGSAVYDEARKSYTIAGGGENMWFATDAFHFVYKRISGDLSLAADIALAGTSGNTHRKGVLIIRQSLDPDSAYADAALHGDGLASLQYRETKGGPTREIQSNISGPTRLQIEKRGDYVWMSIARAGEPVQSAGGSFRMRFSGSFYVGLGVCAHDNNAL